MPPPSPSDFPGASSCITVILGDGSRGAKASRMSHPIETKEGGGEGRKGRREERGEEGNKEGR